MVQLSPRRTWVSLVFSFWRAWRRPSWSCSLGAQNARLEAPPYRHADLRSGSRCGRLHGRLPHPYGVEFQFPTISALSIRVHELSHPAFYTSGEVNTPAQPVVMQTLCPRGGAPVLQAYCSLSDCTPDARGAFYIPGLHDGIQFGGSPGYAAGYGSSASRRTLVSSARASGWRA